MTDDMLRAVAKNGGVVMINYHAAFLSEEFRVASEKKSGSVVASMAALSKKCGGDEACTTMEGERIRDVVPDPRGRYVYLLGRRVHVFDKNGETELRTLDVDDPMAIAASANGSMLAVLATEDFGSTEATVVALYDTTSFAELARDPLQTEKTIEAAMFAAKDRSRR